MIHSPDLESIIVTQAEGSCRLDKLLTLRYPEHSRTYFQYLIEEGFVLLNGQRAKKRLLPKEGDEIEVCFQLTPELSLEAEDIPLDILYEDEHILAINKSAGMVVHPAPGHWSGTFVNALLGYCKQLPTQDPLRPGIVHRLDKDTTGVLIAAKTVEAHQKLIEKFANRTMEKTYLAICIGKPADGIISAPIGRHPIHRKEMAVIPGGRDAVTDVRVIAIGQNLALALLKPKTGRTHQIRVHLKHLKAPILGDTVYGAAKQAADRQMLHAYKLSFSHPITNAPITICAPIPSDMKHWMQQLCGPSLCQAELEPV
jgi:23S rRNA pseudouridine1911/1915/1917 synthase